MSASLTELFKLRCPLSECRAIKIAKGVAMGGAITAGTVKQFGDCLAIAVDDVPVDVSNNSTVESVWVTYAPKVEVAKVAHATARPWVAGDALYYDGVQTAFTDLSTNLARCGFAIEAALSTATSGLMCFIGDLIAPDITTATA